LFASLTLDFFWMGRNTLIHDGTQPSPAKAIKQISYTLGLHCKAWPNSILPSLWTPPFAGCIKGNFDVAIHGAFFVAAAIISDKNGNIILVVTQKLTSSDALHGEVSAALLTSQLAASSGCGIYFWREMLYLLFLPSTILLFSLLGLLLIAFHILV
jgi:hypothetical protein